MRKKSEREKGKIKLSRMFQKLKPGDRVCVERELSVKADFPYRLHGKSGTIEGKKGKTYVVRIRDIGREKLYLIKPIHLKKLR